MANFLDELAKTVKKAAEAQKEQTNNTPAKNVWSESLAPKNTGGSSKSSGSGSSGGGTSTKKQNNSFYEDYQARKQQQSRARFTPSTLLGAATKKQNSSFYDDYQARKKQQQSGRFTPSLLNTGSSARRFTPSVRRQPTAQDWSASLSPVHMRDMLSAETSAATQRRKAAVKQDILNNSKYRFTDFEIDSVINSQNPREDMTALVKRKGGSDTEAKRYGEYVYYNLLDDTHKKQYNKDMDATERQGLGAQYTTDIETQKARTETSNRRLDKLEKEIEEKAKKAVQQLQNQTQTGDQLRDATLKDLTVNSFKQGYYNTRYGEEMYKAMGGMANNSAAYRAKLADNDYQFEPGNWFEKAVSGASGQIGQMVRNATNPTTAATMAAAGGAAAIAGNAGPQSLIPEEVITVPAAISAAYMAGSAANVMKVEAGLAYDEMTQNGISPETASKIALGVGVANSALEAVQLDDLLKSFKILGRSGATGNVAVEIGKALLRRGVDVTKETAEEVAQEGVTIAGSQLANKLDKGEWAYNADEVKNRLKDTAISSALTFGALGAAGDISGTAIGAYDNYRDTANTGRNIRDAGAVQDVIDEGKAQGTGTRAYRQAQNMNADTASNFRVGRQANLNAEAMTDEARLAQLINERTGYDVNYRFNMPSWNAGETVSDTSSDASGATFPSRGRLNINANKGQTVDTLYHETGHAAENLATEEAQAAADKTIEVLQKPAYKAQLDARVNALRQFYDRQGVEYTEQMLLNEIAVDMRRGGLLYRTSADYDRATRTDNYDRDRFIPNTVRRATSTVRSVFGGTVTNENAGITVSAKDANTIREAWERADNASAGAHRTGTATQTGDTNYSIVQQSNGDYKVIADRDIFAGVAPEQRNEVLKNFINDNLRGKPFTALTDGATLNVAQKNKTVQKLYRPGLYMNDKKYAARQETAAHYDEVLEASKKTGTESAKNDKHNNTDVDKRTVEIEIPHFDENNKLIDGEVWKAEISVMNDSDTAYDISKLVNITKDTHSDLQDMLKAHPNIDRVSLSDIISQRDNFVKRNEVKINPDKNVKTDYSVDTSEQTRTDAFKQWFGDWENNPQNASKVVNADGTPKVVYHGTSDEFYIFDAKQGGRNTDAVSAQKAFFFTDDPKIAEGYAEISRPKELDDLQRKYESLERRATFSTNKQLWAEAEAAEIAYNEAELEYVQSEYANGRVMNVYLNMRNPYIVDGEQHSEKFFVDNIKYAKQNGYDGVIFKNTHDSAVTRYDEANNVYAIFEPTQIKSATDNIGTFDKNNPDIRYSVDTNAESEERLTPTRVARRLINDYGAKGNVYEKDVTDALKNLAAEAQSVYSDPDNIETRYEAFEKHVYDLANRIADGARRVDNYAADLYKEIYKDVSDTIIHVTDNFVGDIPEYNDFRKSNFGSLKLSRKQGEAIDTFYQELAEKYPGVFDAREHIAESDMLYDILNKLEGLRTKEYEYSASERETLTENIKDDILNASLNLMTSQQQTNTAAETPPQNAESEDAPPVPNEEDWNNLMTGSEAENQAQRQSAENRSEAERRTQIFMQQQGVTSPRELAPDTVTRRQSEKERSLWKSPSPVRKAMGKAYTAVVDDMHPFWNYNKAYERASKTTTYGKDNPYKLSINAKDASSRAAYIVTDEMVDYDNNSIGKGLVDTITDSGITKDIYDEFNKYLVARHALEWLDPDGHGAVKNVYDDPRLNDMGVVQMMTEDFENAHPEFKQAADNLYEWQRKLMKTWLVDTGVITQEQYDTFTQMYPDYVPFFREQDTTLGRGKVGMANGGSVIKEAVGTESRRILEPIENIMYNVASYVNHGTKHEVIKTAVQQYDMLDSDPENNVLRQYWEEVVPVNPEQEQNLYFRPKRGDDPSVDDATNEGERSISSTLRQQSDVRNGVVSFLDDGKMRYFRVYDKDFLNVLDNVRKGRDGVLAMFAAFSRTRAALITSFNPAFTIASNPARDFGTLITNSTDANKAKIAAGAVSSYYDIAKKSDAYKSYLAMGGQYSSVNTEGMTAMKQALQKLQAKDPNLAKRFFKLFPKGFGVYQTVSDAIEAAPRMAEFKSTLKNGYDYHEAFYRAKDVTTNFSRGGQIAKELNAVSNFFNASIQGVDKYFRQAKNNPKSFAIGITCLTVPALLVWAWNHLGDDKDKKEAYDNLSNYHKNNSYNFYIGNGKFVSIPKARESAVITSGIEMALDKFLAGESDRDKDFFADYMLSQFLPDGSIIGLSTINDLRANKDYMDRPIVSDALSEMPAELQYDDSTSYLAKWLGGALKVSPKQIDHVINSETGVIGKINRTYFTPSSKDDKAAMYSFGVLGTYVKDSLFSTDNLNMFYDNKEKADKQANGYPSADTTYLSNKYTQASGVLSVLNKMYKENSQSDEGREIRKQYVRFARNNKDNPTGLSDEVYNEIKGLYDTDSGVLSLPKVDRTIKSDGESYTFDDAQSVLSYHDDLNEAVDRAYRKIMRGTDYAAMNEDEKVDALSKAKSEAVKEVKKFYVENKGEKRMSFGTENDGKVEKPTQAETEAAQQQRAYRENIENTYMKQAADNFSKVNPDKDGYDVDTMKINDVSSVEIDGTKYSLSGDTKAKVTEAANEKYYADLERYMSGEANIEDIIGYAPNGKARYSNDNNNKRVYLTGKRFNDDGSERFDETISAKIIFRIKDAATEAAAQEYKDEITGAAAETPAEATTEATEETSAAVSDVKTVSRANTSRSGGSSRSTSSSGGSSSSGGTSRVKFTPSGGSSGGASQGASATRLKFTPSGTTSGAAQFTPTASVASAQRFIPSTRETARQMRFIPRTENAVKPKAIKAIQPMQMI